jgi:hypothetical protein
MAIVTVGPLIPPARYDGNAWTQVRVEGADANDGPWTTVGDVIDLAADLDPRHPRTFFGTVVAAGDAPEWRRVVFVDADGNEWESEPRSLTATELRPALTDIGALLRARTKDRNGAEVGTFNDNTRPKASQVNALIDQAVAEVKMRVGPVADELVDSGRLVVAMRVAQLIELSYYPEQTSGDRTVYQTLRLTYEDLVRRLTHAYPRISIG